MKRAPETKSNRKNRHMRIRRKIFGTPVKPRLCVYRSLKHLEAQLVDDLAGATLVSASTKDTEFISKHRVKYGGNVKVARTLGTYLAEKAKDKGLKKVIFDRAGYRYHGRLKAFAEAAREGGLDF